MQTIPERAGMTSSVNQWSRFLGVSLRPWSGYAPLSLILRGLIHLAVCVFLLVLMLRFAGGDGIGGGAQELVFLRGLVIPAIIVLVVLATIAAARVLVGVLDLVPRKHITGVVTSVRERKVGDVLPHLAQRAIFERNANSLDQRKRRTEVVLLTETGERQWTVRNVRTQRLLQPGMRVRLTVSPLVGHVAQVQRLEATAEPSGSST